MVQERARDWLCFPGDAWAVVGYMNINPAKSKTNAIKALAMRCDAMRCDEDSFRLSSEETIPS
jgi:hypothetical protein